MGIVPHSKTPFLFALFFAFAAFSAPVLAGPFLDPLSVLAAQTDEELDEDSDEMSERQRSRSKRRSSRSSGFSAAPQGRTFGIGLQLGTPTGLTGKYMVAPDQGLAFGVGAAFYSALGSGQSLDFHVDYLFHPHLLVGAEAIKLTWYVGPGLFLALVEPGTVPYFPGPFWYPGYRSAWLGLRVPIGLDLAFKNLPIEIFLEGVPMLLAFPVVGFGMGASLGLRFYF
jgi:hypothetical protein